MQLADWLIYPVNLTPHGYCLLWAPGLIWLHAISDMVIGLAYFSIPLALIWFVRRRQDLEFRWVFLLFICFILACGMTHFMAVYTLWIAAYGAEGLIKVATAIFSVATAWLLWPLIPRLLALPAPAELAALNAQLEQKVLEQERTHVLLRSGDERIRASNFELEERVAARTADLVASNERLRATLMELEGTKATLEATVVERTDALSQRDLLLREVYHRVKNNLQIVDALIVMQQNSMADVDARLSLDGLRDRVHAIGLVHQQLMTSMDLNTFELAPFLAELTENLVVSSASGNVQIAVDAAPLRVDLDFAVPLGLIVTELVTNSLKHAFPDGHGRVAINVARNSEEAQNPEIVVTVSDDGIGQPISESGGQKTGIGKRLVDGLLRQLQGHMVVETSVGSTIRLYLPEPKLA